MELIPYLRRHIQLSPGIEEAFDLIFQRMELPKGHVLLYPETFSKKVFFIEKGLTRIYYLKDGKDITHHFFAEDAFTMPIDSIFYDRPARYGLELLENSTIRAAVFTEVEKYVTQSPGLEKLIRYLLIDVLKVFSDHLYAIQFQSAKDRYQTMIEQYPDILLRAPLGHIASYLGITQQTLSVIRSRLNRDEWD